MNGVIFTLGKRRKRRALPELKLPSVYEIKSLIRRRGAAAFFTAAVIAGLIIGSVSVSGLSGNTLKSMDLLFTTNLPERLKGGLTDAFAAGFASDFIFLSASVLCALSLWGAVFLPLIAAFKGFGIGLSASYLVSSYGIKGALFYFLIILPGVFLFSLALIYELSACYSINKKIIINLVKGKAYPLKGALSAFFRKSVKYLLAALIASAVDAILWVLFAGLFKL